MATRELRRGTTRGDEPQPKGETMKITVIPTMYRDASNWKVHGEIHLQGELAEADIQAARAALSDGLYYVPGRSASRITDQGSIPATPPKMITAGKRCASTKSK